MTSSPGCGLSKVLRIGEHVLTHYVLAPPGPPAGPRAGSPPGPKQCTTEARARGAASSRERRRLEEGVTMKSKGRYAFAMMVLVAAARAEAGEPGGAQASGFSGHLSLGSVFASTRTNMVSSAGFGLLKLGDAAPDSLNGQPGARNGVLPAVAFSVRYAVPRTGTELFAGNSRGDTLQAESFLEGGVRQAIGAAGTLSLAYLYGLSVNVWADPYATGVKRKETTRGSQGARLGWERVLGSALQVQATFRNIAIDREASGDLLNLSADDVGQLRRAGNTYEGELRYPFTLAGVHRLTPALIYAREELQGEAMSANAYELRLGYAYRTRAFMAMLDGSIGRSTHDRRNPVFRKTQADLRYAASATVVLRTPFGWAPFGYQRWSLFATAGYTAADSNIDFYSASILDSGAGLSMEF